MNDKKFNAILAKNQLARIIRDHDRSSEPRDRRIFPTLASISCLETIEAYLGEANQPSVKSIIGCKEYDL